MFCWFYNKLTIYSRKNNVNRHPVSSINLPKKKIDLRGFMIFFICAKSAIFSMDNQSFFLLVFDGILAPFFVRVWSSGLKQSDKIKLKRSQASWSELCQSPLGTQTVASQFVLGFHYFVNNIYKVYRELNCDFVTADMCTNYRYLTI